MYDYVYKIEFGCIPGILRCTNPNLINTVRRLQQLEHVLAAARPTIAGCCENQPQSAQILASRNFRHGIKMNQRSSCLTVH